jgi:hypothetical protein
MMNNQATIGTILTGRDAQRQAHLAQIRAVIAATPNPGVLTAEEQEDLILMREEEKLARDVYLHLYERWGLPPFHNISGSEQVHMDAILALLEQYNLPDPVQGLSRGQFRSPAMQALYDKLVEEGSRNQVEAIHVGLLVEELDIADLRTASSRTNKSHILEVYDELDRGSRNHLRAFYKWMQRLGSHYNPEHLSLSDFDSVAHSAHESCH